MSAPSSQSPTPAAASPSPAPAPAPYPSHPGQVPPSWGAAPPAAGPPAAWPPQASPVTGDPRHRSPFVASVLSLLPGLGQVYTGYYRRGFVHALVVGSAISLLQMDLDELTPLVALFMVFFWLYNVVDAGRRATLYNLALSGTSDIELPKDFNMTLPGSLVGGVTIAVVGFVLLLKTRFGISLAWVGEWWPLAVVAFGVHLVIKAVQERSTREGAGGTSEP